jgi:hypothetical protein
LLKACGNAQILASKKLVDFDICFLKCYILWVFSYNFQGLERRFLQKPAGFFTDFLGIEQFPCFWVKISHNATVKYATTMKEAWNVKFLEFKSKNISYITITNVG